MDQDYLRESNIESFQFDDIDKTDLPEDEIPEEEKL